MCSVMATQRTYQHINLMEHITLVTDHSVKRDFILCSVTATQRSAVKNISTLP